MAILKIKDKDGKVQEILAIQGKKPVKGVDYWTKADIQEIQQYVDNQLEEIRKTLEQLLQIDAMADECLDTCNFFINEVEV